MIYGAVLHVIVALFFAVHAVRTGQPSFWLFVLLSFPLLGSVVYFFAVYLPQSRLQGQARRAARSVVRVIDPLGDVRQAQADFDDTPTAQNQMRLAQALLAVGKAADAAAHYDACLQGPFARDVEVRFGAGQTFVECGREAQALSLLQDLQQERPDYREEETRLLIARAQAALGQTEAAARTLQDAVARHGSYAARAEWAIWQLQYGQPGQADALLAELDATAQRWNPTTRELNAPAFKRLKQAREQARASAAAQGPGRA